jgi:hypothetical protein
VRNFCPGGQKFRRCGRWLKSILGGGAGRIRGGQHISFKERTPLANVHVTLLQRAGVPIDKVGDSTGAIAEI